MKAFRKICVLAAAVLAVALSQFHELTGLGVPVSRFAAEADETLRAAGYAFAVWGLLYLGMLVFALFHLSRRGDRSVLAGLIAWPAAVAFAACAAWTVAASLQIAWLTLVIILVGAVALNERFMGAAGADARGAERSDRWLVLWPLAALAGWLTVASALNVVSVVERYGWLRHVPTWAVSVAAVSVVTGVGLFVAHRTRSIAHPALVAWGLAAVAVAEAHEKQIVAGVAALGALVCVVGGLILARRERSVELAVD